MRKLLIISLLLLISIGLVAPTMAQSTTTIYDTANSNSNLSHLMQAIQVADPSVRATLESDNLLTIFAPTNQAFEDLAITLDMPLEDLLADANLVTNILLYHVLDGEYRASNLAQFDGQFVNTIFGDEIIFIDVNEDGTVMLNDIIQVAETDMDASNGVIHVVNDILLPGSVLAQLGMQPTVGLDDGSGMVNVRVAHFAADAPAVSVYLDGEAILNNFGFGSVSNFMTIPAGEHEIAVSVSGAPIEEAVIGPMTVDFLSGEIVTIAAIGSLENQTLTATMFNALTTEMAEGQARVQVFHAIEGAPAVNVMLADGTVLVPNLAYPNSFERADGELNDGSFIFDVPANVYDLQVTPSEMPETILIDLSGTQLDAGNYYLVVALGTLDSPSIVLQPINFMQIMEMQGMEDTISSEEDMVMDENIDDDAVMNTTVGDVVLEQVNTTGEFSMLLQAIQSTDPAVLATLQGEQPITVFVPTNEAFTTMLDSLGLTMDEFLADDVLFETLLFHVIGDELSSAELLPLNGLSVQTMLPDNFIEFAVLTDSSIVLNGTATVVQTDMEASNGMIHVIDSVLLPQVALEAFAFTD